MKRTNFFIKYFKLSLTLLLFWFLIAGEFNAHMLPQIIFANLATLYLLRKMNLVPDIKINKYGTKYSLMMIKNMFESSVQVLKTLRHPVDESNKYISGIKEVKFKNISRQPNAALHAAAITMTPGTMVISINREQNSMLVHSLDKKSFQDMPEKKITKIIDSNIRSKKS